MEKRRPFVGGVESGFNWSRRAALAFISSRTSDAATPLMTISISLLRLISMRSISRSAAERLARCSIQSRFISRVNSTARLDRIQGAKARYKGTRKNTLDVRRAAVIPNLQSGWQG